MPFEPAKTLNSRTFIALVLSQFLAAFNDQAVHIAAILYGSDMLVRYANSWFLGYRVSETMVISLVTGCFISPFFFFSPLAGILADKYSKRSVLVFWKMAEVAIMGLCFFGFLLPHLSSLAGADSHAVARWSALLVIAAVFLMGTHSAFFVPAKYGVMPEILHSSVLSRGNGLLEGTSFVAQILGTSFGGVLFWQLSSDINGDTIVLGKEWLIGAVLLGLAVIGAVASTWIQRMPAATPHKPLVLNPWTPLRANLAALFKSRSLVLAVIGIAFFSFMTLFLRQTVILQGETDKDREWVANHLKDPSLAHLPDEEEAPAAIDAPTTDAEVVSLDRKAHAPAAHRGKRKSASELESALLISVVGLGVGIGCVFAGALSGHRLELGLVTIGLALMVLLTALLGAASKGVPTVICLLLVGISAGLYIVPLYTLLQHRAPKDSKGNMVATSNFLNVAGGLVAIAVFTALSIGLQGIFGLNLTRHDVAQTKNKAEHREMLERYQEQLEKRRAIPHGLFFGGSLITATMLSLLCWKRPDFVARSVWLLKHRGRRDLQGRGLHNLPSYGPAILLTNCEKLEQMLDVLAVIDRQTRFFVSRPPTDLDQSFLSRSMQRNKLLVIDTPSQHASGGNLSLAARTLADGNLVALVFADQPDSTTEHLLSQLQSEASATLLPVLMALNAPNPNVPGGPPVSLVTIGVPLPADAQADEIRQALRDLGVMTPELAAEH